VDLPKLVSEEARAFLDSARGDRFEALYVVAVITGLRRGELLALRWTDMELDGIATLRVGRQLQRMRDGSGLIFVAPKGGKGRTIRFVQELLGHADIKLTLGTYSHFLPSMGDQTATAMESALG
jgi:integrase